MIEVDKQTMDSLKALADTNLKISEAKRTLIKLEEKETEYLEAREKKAIEKIQKVLDESRDLLKETQSNYHEIHQLCNTVSTFASELGKAYEKFSGMLSDFNERSDAWEKEVIRQQEEIAATRKIIQVDQQTVANDKEGIKKREESIKRDQIRIESQRAQIKSALEVLKTKQK